MNAICFQARSNVGHTHSEIQVHVHNVPEDLGFFFKDFQFTRLIVFLHPLVAVGFTAQHYFLGNPSGHFCIKGLLPDDVAFQLGHCRQHGFRSARTDDHLIGGRLVLLDPLPQTVGDESVIAGRAVVGCDQRFYAVLSEFRQYEPQLL